METISGDWDEIEPQVYDLLLPADAAAALAGADGRGVLRLAFDPEALPEHPAAQLASFGTPLVDRLLADAMRRGRFTQLYFIGLNLAPHDLANRARRALTLASADLRFRLGRVRTLHFAQAIYVFQAAFVSDQKEQEIVPVGIDLHYGRQVRHLEQLLDNSRLSDRPAELAAEARRLSVAAGYPLARERVVRTVAALANIRSRELGERLAKQTARMSRYYADLRQELADQNDRATARAKEPVPDRLAARRDALDREEKLRVAELRQKSSLHVELRLLNLQVLQQPKLLLQAQLVSEKAAVDLELVWDPLLDALEAPPCPTCGRPGFAFSLLTRPDRLVCSACAATPVVGVKR